MAQASNRDDELISGINVTPLVDVVLVLLVILMVTAGYIASQAIPVELPRATTGQTQSSTLMITLTSDGTTFLDAAPVSPEALSKAIREAKQKTAVLRAMIAADGSVPHRRVVGVVDILRSEGVTQFALNVQPDEASRK